MEYLCGLDEAGRGPVIGPMVVASVCLKSSNVDMLSRYISRDSKKYSKRQRLRIYQLIQEIDINYRYYIISPSEINEWMIMGRKINDLEFKYFLKAILDIFEEIYNPGHKFIIYIDSPDIKPDRFGERFLKSLSSSFLLQSDIKVVSEHKADEKYLPVSIASIIAKVIRDKEVDRLQKIIGKFGSGYPSDPKTREFIKKLVLEDKIQDYSNYIRIRWKTIENILREVRER